MRIAIATWSRRLAGGVETYLSALVPALLERGHHVALFHEVDEPRDRAPITSSPSVPNWCAADGEGIALAALKSWAPDVIFAQGLEDPALEARVAAIAPAVLFAHAYRGTCISGTKSFAARGHASCHHRLGASCMVRYFPNRCGGLNPITMASLYRRESRRRDQFDRYAAVVVFSEHMRRELVRHGVDGTRLHRLPCHIPAAADRRPQRTAAGSKMPSRILFAGRMEAQKGGDVLIDALPLVQDVLKRPLQMTFVGDGRLRAAWEQRAARALGPAGSTRVEFAGWIGADARSALLRETDLLVVPSLWPEPFGLIGLEAAACGVPAAAFDVGGISEWLLDGVNGYLAPGDRPTAEGLANAMVKCLRDHAVHASLVAGAFEVASHHSIEAHVAALLRVLTASTGHPISAGRTHLIGAAQA